MHAKSLRSLALATCVLAALLCATGAAAARTLGSSPAAAHDPSTILVKFGNSADAARVVAAHGDRHLGSTATRV
jgi:ABC-type sugar transport system substrate-binding protein